MLYSRTLLFIHSIYNSLYFLISISHSLPSPTCQQHRAAFTPEFQQNVEYLSPQGLRAQSSFVITLAHQLCLLPCSHAIISLSFLSLFSSSTFRWHFHFTVACNQATLSTLSASYQQLLKILSLWTLIPSLEDPSLVPFNGRVLIHLLFIHLSAGAGIKIYI